VVPAAVHRIAAQVVERVVHPAQIPLHAEAQAAVVDRPRHPPHDVDSSAIVWHVGVRGVDRAVALLQEPDRVAVVVGAVDVGHPLAGLARVVAVQHRRDAVDPQRVDVVALEPAQRRRDQERPHLVARVVEDVAGPVGVEAAPRIGVLVEVGAVEPAQAVGVGREVRGHPVDDHPDAGLVQRVDHRHQIVGRAVATGRREVAGDLVAPRAVERVGQDRHQLDVGEAQAAGVLGQALAERAVVERRAVIAVRRASTSRGGPRRSTTARRAGCAAVRARPSTRRRCHGGPGAR
jgi:hypothetical protein